MTVNDATLSKISSEDMTLTQPQAPVDNASDLWHLRRSMVILLDGVTFVGRRPAISVSQIDSPGPVTLMHLLSVAARVVQSVLYCMTVL